MVRLYILSGIVICGLFAYASQIGWSVIDFEHVSSKKVQGAGVYHK
jgi:hypothetical protein